MSRVVIVSNRVAVPKGSAAAGGLAVAILAAMHERGGVWFGWGGETHPAGTAQPAPETAVRDGGTFTTISIDAGLQELHYDGFANAIRQLGLFVTVMQVPETD